MTDTPTAYEVSQDTIASYRDRGFVHLPGILTLDEVDRYRDAVVEFRRRHSVLDGRPQDQFAQYVDAWQSDSTLGELTANPRIGAAAEALAGIPLRLWHDQLLIKDPHNGAATEFHQDAPYWPHAHRRHALSAWVALVDVPVERGCMTFIPGSQHQTALARQDLTDATSLMSIWPDAVWEERVTIPLRAGDCTFHNAFTAHTANANDTDDPRIAQVVIFVDAETQYSGAPHPVTDELDLTVDAVLPDDRFPRVAAG